MCAEVMSDDFDFYNNLVRDDDDDDDVDNDDDCHEQQLEDNCNEPPTKKAKPSMHVHSLNCCDDGTLGEEEAAAFLSKLGPKQLNTLMAQIVKKQQEESKDSYVFSYQNVNNNKTMQYVRVPRNKLDDTDESFTTINKNNSELESVRFQNQQIVQRYIVEN